MRRAGDFSRSARSSWRSSILASAPRGFRSRLRPQRARASSDPTTACCLSPRRTRASSASSNCAIPKYRLKNVSSTFHGRDIFAPAAAWLSYGDAAHLARPAVPACSSYRLRLRRDAEQTLMGEVIYVDGFGNLMTNLDHARLTLSRAAFVPPRFWLGSGKARRWKSSKLMATRPRVLRSLLSAASACWRSRFVMAARPPVLGWRRRTRVGHRVHVSIESPEKKEPLHEYVARVGGSPVLSDIPRYSQPGTTTARAARAVGIPTVNAALFLLTLLTTTMAGAYMAGADLSILRPFSSGLQLYAGLSFSIPLMAILLAHEMGHYIFARRYGVDVSRRISSRRRSPRSSSSAPSALLSGCDSMPRTRRVHVRYRRRGSVGRLHRRRLPI